MIKQLSTAVVVGLISVLPVSVLAQQTPAQAVEAAKNALDQAIRAGGEKEAPDDIEAAKGWLSQATAATSVGSTVVTMTQTNEVRKLREDEAIYLATMARLKAMSASAKAQRVSIALATRRVQRELDDFQGAIMIAKTRQEEAEKARADLARANQAIAELETKRGQELRAKQDDLDKARADLTRAADLIEQLDAKQLVMVDEADKAKAELVKLNAAVKELEGKLAQPKD